MPTAIVRHRVPAGLIQAIGYDAGLEVLSIELRSVPTLNQGRPVIFEIDAVSVESALQLGAVVEALRRLAP